MFGEGVEAVFVEIGGGISDKTSAVGAARIAAGEATLAPVRGVIVVGIWALTGEDEAEALAIGAGGPWRIIAVGEFEDGAAGGVFELDEVASVVEPGLVLEFTGDVEAGTVT